MGFWDEHQMKIMNPRAGKRPGIVVAFDFDGTIGDTARDFFQVINQLVSERRGNAIEESGFRQNMASIDEMMHYAFGKDHPDLSILKTEFEARYENHCTKHTVLFPGMRELLDELDGQQIAWGIISNKPTDMLHRVAAHFGLVARAQFVLAAETLSEKKPNPAPLLHACKLQNVEPHQMIYVGDMHTDVLAAKRAGAKSVAVSFGYHPKHPKDWDLAHEADHIADHPSDIKRAISNLAQASSSDIDALTQLVNNPEVVAKGFGQF